MMDNETDDYIENCNSSNYIKKWLEFGKSKEYSIQVGILEHIKDLEDEMIKLREQLEYMS